MSDAIRPLVAGNWKMNGLKTSLREALTVKAALIAAADTLPADALLAPPATLLMVMAEACRGGPLAFAGQDCHIASNGAHTGDIAAEMMRDAGATAVILGHSERRGDHGETSAAVAAKVTAAHRAGLMAIVCVGETLGQRHAGLTLSVVARQVAHSLPAGCTRANTTLAYEPVWAIGTGLTPSVEDVATVHSAIRNNLVAAFGTEGAAMRILYGGSVKPDNARALLSVANVNGALVGGASLKADDFLAILRSYSD